MHAGPGTSLDCSREEAVSILQQHRDALLRRQSQAAQDVQVCACRPKCMRRALLGALRALLGALHARHTRCCCHADADRQPGRMKSSPAVHAGPGAAAVSGSSRAGCSLEEGIGSEEAGDDSMIDIREEWDEALHGAPSSGELLQLTFTRRMPLPVHP